MLGLCELRQGFREGTVTVILWQSQKEGEGFLEVEESGRHQAVGWLAWDCPPRGAREEACWWPPDGWDRRNAESQTGRQEGDLLDKGVIVPTRVHTVPSTNSGQSRGSRQL